MKNKRRQEHFFDYTLLIVVLFLIGFGLVMIYSTSSYEAALEHNGDASYYLEKQGIASIIGLFCMVAAILIPYRFWRNFTLWYYLIAAVMILLLLTPLGVTRNGATRWLDIGLPMNIQPAEVVKICMIFFFAGYLCKVRGSLKSWRGILISVLLPLPIVAMVYFISNNLSSAIIVLGICILMIFVASADYKKFFIMAAPLVAGAAGYVIYVVKAAEKASASIASGVNENLNIDFRGERILAWLDPERYAQKTGYQTLQSLYAIGSGGVFGKGLGQSMQKLGFIPEAQNDMIFSIICEELGLFGAFAVILLFILLIWRCMVIANNTDDMYGAMIVVGVMSHFIIQVLLNIAVVTNSIPNTGISLPFISYGGSSVLFLMIEIGLVLNVSRSIIVGEA